MILHVQYYSKPGKAQRIVCTKKKFGLKMFFYCTTKLIRERTESRNDVRMFTCASCAVPWQCLSSSANWYPVKQEHFPPFSHKCSHPPLSMRHPSGNKTKHHTNTIISGTVQWDNRKQWKSLFQTPGVQTSFYGNITGTNDSLYNAIVHLQPLK